jgi:hypothetical protein
MLAPNGRGPNRQVDAMRAANDGVFRFLQLPPDFSGRQPLKPQNAQLVVLFGWPDRFCAHHATSASRHAM